ncbi:MAG: hypothetical protein AAGA97_00740 [Pseudomonadota bacterium]
MTGLVFAASFFFEFDTKLMRVREDTQELLLRFGLLFIAFGLAIMLTHVFGDKQEVKIQGLIFTGTLASAYGVLYLAEVFVLDSDKFSHPNLDLVVTCRTSPDFLERDKMSAMVRLNADEGKIKRVAESSSVLPTEDYKSTFTHLFEPSKQVVYITPTRDGATEYRFQINDLLPISSNDKIDVLLASASQTLDPAEYVIFSSYFATGDTKRLIAEINLEDAGEVCDG